MSDQDAPTQKQLPHSGFGIASLVINLTAVLMMVEASKGGMGYYLFIFAGSIAPVGFVLGVAGLFQKGRKKLYAILGFIASFPAFFLVGNFIAIAFRIRF